ncbi:unnamed protein product [Heligmosomoides polygyrus]|uniref:Uncharacterized protein n=1 Tax=Heligmosomoides polygyrus TaxID=6339 RepID=A0A183FYR2_HELPZ|nr:unnamed protein product [Heligmosomoides polygyrus]
MGNSIRAAAAARTGLFGQQYSIRTHSEFFRNPVLSWDVPYDLKRHAIKRLPQVEKGKMHLLFFLAMLLQQKPGGMYGIGGANQPRSHTGCRKT